MFDLFKPASRMPHYASKGEKLIKTGKVAALLLAGGQGTRLGGQYLSKGFYPVGPFSHKTLFALFAGKVKAASVKWDLPLSLAIMTSPLNDEAIRTYFAENRYFGLHPDQVFFFQQPLLPFLDEKGNILDEKGPCGNGVAIQELFASGIGKVWEERGVECFTTLLIDNPLADPFPVELIGFHQGRDLSALVTKRRDLAEKVGIYVKTQDHVRVCEYMEFPIDEWPRHDTANLSQFCFSLSFAKKAQAKPLPLHKISKGSVIKCEYFIIDFVERAEDFHALEYPRELCFAPLKNSEGSDSIEGVKQAIQKRDRLRWQELFFVDPENISFELSPQFYYPHNELLARYKGQMPQHNSYIE